MLTYKRLFQLCQDGFTDQTEPNHMAHFTGPTTELTCLRHALRSDPQAVSPEHFVQYNKQKIKLDSLYLHIHITIILER